MEFSKEDENYIYNVIGKNVKKYRKEKGLTQAQLAEKMDYSLSFVSSLESKKHQTFSLGALWRISLVLGIDMYKLCIDESDIEIYKPKYVKYICNKCGYETDIPYELIELLTMANSIDIRINNFQPLFKCKNCDGFIISKNDKQ